MDDLDAWLDDYEAPTVSVTVCGKAGLLDAHARADAALAQAQADASDMLASAELNAARRAVEDIEAQIEASQKRFTFQGIGHRAWRDLKRKYPPTEPQRRDGYDCDLEKFAPEAISKSAIDPEISTEQVAVIARKLPEGEYEKLYEAVLQANGVVVGAPKSVLAALIGGLQESAASSTTAVPEVLPAASSTADSDVPSTGRSTTKKTGSSGSRSRTTRSSSPKTTAPRSNGRQSKT